VITGKGDDRPLSGRFALILIALVSSAATAAVVFIELTLVRSDHLVLVLAGAAVVVYHGAVMTRVLIRLREAAADTFRLVLGRESKYLTPDVLKTLRKPMLETTAQRVAFGLTSLLVFSTPVFPVMLHFFFEVALRHAQAKRLPIQEQEPASVAILVSTLVVCSSPRRTAAMA
jgi:hypothetical protein